MGGKRYGECSDGTIRRYLVDKRFAWLRDGVPFHIWLTSRACEVLDITFAINLGDSRTRDECARRIVYKPAHSVHFCSKWTLSLNRIDPQSYLQYVLERIADHPINRIEELLPWNVADKLKQPEQVTKAVAAA
jgi:hypothetical protein